MTKRPKITQQDQKSGRRLETPPLRPDYEAYPPAFSFYHVMSGFGLSDCLEEAHHAFVDGMLERSQMSWTELGQAPRAGRGYERIPLYRIRVPTPPALTKQTTILAFRCGGLRRMIGFRDEATFHVVWFDRDGKVYPHS